MSWRHRAAVALVVVAVIAGLASRASAHAELESTSPASGAVVPISPTAVVLTFTEQVSIVVDSVRVLAPDGAPVALGDAVAHGSTVEASVPPLADGTYVVAWKVVSVDSHPIGGAFSFSVGAPSENAAASTTGTDDSLQPAKVVLDTAKALSYAAVALVVGVLVMAVFCSTAAVQRRRVGAVLWAAVAAGVIATVTMVSAQAALTQGSWLTIGHVADSPAVRWWLVRASALLASATLIWQRRRLLNGPGVAVLSIWAVSICAIVAAGGHGTSGRHAQIGYAATTIHVLGMCLWVGGITVLALSRRDELDSVARRLSPIAFGSVVALSVTGTLNAWRQSGSWNELSSSTYGRWLLVKLSIVLLVVSVAAVNRWLLRHGEAPPELRRTTIAELIGLAAIMALTAGLVGSPPPSATGRISGTAAAVTITVHEGDRSATVTINPATTTGALTVAVATPDGKTPTAVAVRAELPSAQLGPIDIPGGHLDSNTLTIPNIGLPFTGGWTLHIVASFDQFDATVFDTTLTLD